MFFDCIILICPIDPMNNHIGISNLKKVIIYLLMYFHISNTLMKSNFNEILMSLFRLK